MKKVLRRKKAPVFLYANGSGRTLPDSKTIKGWKGKKVVALSPHSDDLSIGAGGLLTMLAHSNTVQPVLAFTGWRGVNGGAGKDKAIRIRENEMAEEADILGLERPISLRLQSYDDDTKEKRQQDRNVVADLLAELEPDIVLMPDPADRHPRHMQIAKFAQSALKKLNSNVEVIYYETPWSLLDTKKINLVVPLDQRAVAAKKHAISVHASQLERNNFVSIAQAMMMLRAYVIPELLGGFGKTADLGERAEVYHYQAAV